MEEEPLPIAVFFSGGASALKYLSENDPAYDVGYRVVAAFTNKTDGSGIELCGTLGVPVTIFDFKGWCRINGIDRPFAENNLYRREEYFEEVDRLAVKPSQPKLIILSGFMLKLPPGFVRRHINRMLNVHPSLPDDHGVLKYKGARAVEDAFTAGETHTGSTIHVVDEETDHGPIVTISDPLPILAGVTPDAHQNAMKDKCDGPAYVEALKLVCDLGPNFLDSLE